MAGSRVVVGVVTVRSVEVPSPAAAIKYTVSVDDGGQPVDYPNIVPLDYYRLSSVFEDLDLVPFEVGQRVPIGISTLGATTYIDILAGELPNAGPCEGTEPSP